MLLFICGWLMIVLRDRLCEKAGGCCRWDNYTYPKKLNFVNLYLKNMNKTHISGLTSEGRGFTLSSNKTNYSSHLYEDKAIYLKTIR